MFGGHYAHTRRAQRITRQAWSSLTSAVDNAGAVTRSAARRAVDSTDHMGERLNGVTREARRRADRAYDALAGRPAPRPWGWLAAAGVVGLAVGWIATEGARRLAARNDVLALQRSVVEPAPRRVTTR